ncbi:MAG: CTP synthase [Chloroflexi bacterium]|nr:CTP synthase [Chloroflexota bacterium]
MSKFIFVTGGVVSSVGKGIAVASTGRILKSRGLTVSVQKLDPYLNVDPGTMSPYQHGEVFVTRDGCETDLDLGHYERFIDVELTRTSNVTSGQIYSSVIAKERRGEFLGGTMQVVPHVTNEIKKRMLDVAHESKADVIIVEVGGTVGDIEGLPFLEAIRQMRNDVGKDNVLYIHVTYLPYIYATGELKTKPTQHSVKELRAIGIQPDIILARSDFPVADDIKGKIALFCDVQPPAVIPVLTVQNIYEVPVILEEAGLGNLVMSQLHLHAHGMDLAEWRAILGRMADLKEPVQVAIVGKYVQLKDSYISVREALRHAGIRQDRDVRVSWISAEDLEQQANWEGALASVNGIVVPGGFGGRGIEGMIRAAQYAREKKVPYLGLCLGMQIMVIEYARHVLGLEEANSSEFDPQSSAPVIDFMPDQRHLDAKGGTMRLGNYPCHLVPGSIASRAYGNGEVIMERHRHRYEVNNVYRDRLIKAGLLPSGLSPDGRLVEISEVVDHPFMVGSQFHPEFRSRPNRPHPLFDAFISVAKSTMREGGQHALPIDKA